MGWSTQQLADLAGVTLRSIRHYHQAGVLAEPPRKSNGYKEYQLEHLLTVLKIKRLTSIGLSLKNAQQVLQDSSRGEEMLEELESELESEIARLQRVREEVVALRTMHLPPQLPTSLVSEYGLDLADATDGEVELAFLIQHLEDTDVSDIDIEDPELIEVGAQFRELSDDSTESEKAALVARIVAVTRQFVEGHETVQLSSSQEQAINAAVTEYLNPAQVDVIARAIQEFE